MSGRPTHHDAAYKLRAVRDVDTSDIAEGALFYVVSLPWLNRWLDFVFKAEDPPHCIRGK